MIDIFIPTIRQDLSGVLDSIARSTTLPHQVHVIREGGSYAEAINLQFELLRSSRSPTDYFVCAADDVRFYPSWDTEAMQVGGDVIGTNDLHHPLVLRGKHSTHYIVRYGYVFERGGTVDRSYPVLYQYRHNYTDTEFIETAKSRGCYRHAPKSIVEHLHPCFGLALDDVGYQKSSITAKEDEATYLQRRHLWGTSHG